MSPLGSGTVNADSPLARRPIRSDELVLAFESLGYQGCDDGSLESGFEKIALYAIGMMYTHVARQLGDGRWTSKLGQLEDITHSSTEAIEDSDYGEVVQFMRRTIE